MLDNIDSHQENKYKTVGRIHERITYRIRQFVFVSLAIIAGVAWSDTLRLMYTKSIGKLDILPSKDDSILLSSSYALVITCFGVLLTIFIAWLSSVISDKIKKHHA